MPIKSFSLVVFVLVLAGCSFANNQIDPRESTDIEKTAEFEVQTIVAQAALQSVVESTARAPTTTPVPGATPIPTPAPTSRPTQIPPPTPAPTATLKPTPTPTPTRTPVPTATPIPRLLGERYLASDGVYVTLRSLSVTEAGNSTTVSVSYTLTNTTGDLKEEKTWKLFYQGTGGLYFGVHGALLPKQSIDRTFSFSAIAPNGLLVLAYPSEYSDSSWDQDDLIWNVTQLLLN